jgi:group I intron endonuclease
MPSGIYSIRNVVSDRVYVGSAVNVKQRWLDHKKLLRKGKHFNRLIQCSWDKHGEESFIFTVLEPIEDANLLIGREQFWIDSLDAANTALIGFNLSPRAGSQLGVKRSPETRAKIRAARLGKKYKLPPRTPEHCAAISASRTGKRRSIESRLKQSTLMKGRRPPPFSDEHKANISAAKKGKSVKMPPFSEEHRANLSAAKRGKSIKLPPFSAEHLANITTAAKLRRRRPDGSWL